ncbi:MAG: hypothetical protein R6X14_07660 [bacterium]
MPKCPHCGELYRYGQDKCYACGQPVKGRGNRSTNQVNPLIFIIAGGVVVIALLGVVLVTSNRASVARQERARVEQERVRDSVRAANMAARVELRRTRREDTIEGEIADLELRLERVAARAERGRLTPEQTELATEVDAKISRLRQLLAAMANRGDEDQAAISDTIRTGVQEVRELLTQFGRRAR